MSYAELHCHSTFSMLDGAAHPEQLVARAVALGLGALALTDHDDVGGVVRFATAARQAEFAGLIGVELSVEVMDRLGTAEPKPLLTHLVLLAEDRVGYGNLCTLITRARLDHPRGRPRVNLDTLARHAGGLFALTGCPRGWVPRLVARGAHDDACAAAATLVDLSLIHI